MIKVQFEYRLKELRVASRAILTRSGTTRRIISLVLTVVILTLFVVPAILTLALKHMYVPPAGASTAAQPSAQPWLIQQWPWVAIFFCLWFGFFRLIRRQTVRRNHVLLGKLWTLEADGNGVTFSDAVTRAERKWGAFQSFVEKNDFFLLLIAPKLAVIVPKRIFDPPSLDEFRQLARTNIHPKIGGFPVIPLAQNASEAVAPKNM